jgi:hypothetical protein
VERGRNALEASPPTPARLVAIEQIADRAAIAGV